MTEPVVVEASRLFEFIRQSELAVVLVSVHKVHAFSRALGRQLASEYDDVAMATVDFCDLVASGGSALRYLHEGLRRSGSPSAFGVLPGYYLFQRGQVIAWDAGLPAFADAGAITRSALLGALWAGVNHDLAFVRQALEQAADEVAAQRIAVRFRAALAAADARRHAAPEPEPPPVDELFWAYQVLGVLPTASDRDVHDAWRKRRMEAHPDHAGGDAAEFERRSRISRDINRARDIIMEQRHGRARARAS